MSDVLAAALRYAAAGIQVFPCVPAGKKPITEHGYLDASTDPGVITAWIKRWPTANLGVPTGAPGYDVLDIDVRPDGDGWAAFHQARRAGLTAGWTHAVRTPSGGLHLYYPGSEQRSSVLASRHLDFRSLGGYVVVPPSQVRTGHGDDGYQVTARNDRPPRTLDWDAVRSLVAPPQTAPTRPSAASTAAESSSVADWLARWVARQGEGNRNHALFWAACRAAERGVTDPAPIVAAAVAAGLTEQEAATTVASAYRRATGRAGVPGPPQLATGREDTITR